MTFAEFVDASNASYLECDDALNRFSTFAEASYNEYLTNIKEAELKVIKESGTEDDYVYLEKEASEGFIVRAKKTIQKIIDTIVKFVKDIVEKIENFFTDKKVDATIKKVDKASKTNPKLKSKKVTIPDYKKGVQAFKMSEDKADKKLSMMRAGKHSKDDKKEIDDIKSDFNKKKAVAVAGTIAVPIGVAIGVLKLARKNAKENASNTETAMHKLPEGYFDGSSDNVTDMEDMFAVRANIAKEHSKFSFDTVQKIFKSIRTAVTGSGEVEPSLDVEDLDNFDESVNNYDIQHCSEKVEEKSMEELDALLNDIIQEASEEVSPEFDDETIQESVSSVDIDAQLVLESIENELFGNSETDENNEFDTQQYLESMEAELFGNDDEVETESVTPEEYLESMEAELFGDDDEVETESVTPEEYLESLENELFGDDETDVEESSDDNEDDSDSEPAVQVSSRPGSDLVMTLESLEKELFGDEEEVAEESEGLTVDEYLDKLEDEYLQ